MRGTILLLTTSAFILSACATASNPKQTMLELDERDPKFESAACLDARNAAMRYDDKVLARMGTGLALGLFLGPLGIPLAAAADMNQNKEREYMNKEIDRR